MNNDQHIMPDMNQRKIQIMREFFQCQQRKQGRVEFINQSRARTLNTIVDTLCKDAVDSALKQEWNVCDAKLNDLIQYLHESQYIENEQLGNLKSIIQYLTRDKAIIMDKILKLFSFNAARRYFSPMLLQHIDQFYQIDNVLNSYLVFINMLIKNDPILLQEQCLVQEIEETHKYACMTQTNLSAWFDVIQSLCNKEGYTYNFKNLLPILLQYQKERPDLFLKFLITFISTEGQEEAAVKFLFRYTESVDFVLEIMYDGNTDAIQIILRISEFSQQGSERIIEAGVLDIFAKLFYNADSLRRRILNQSIYILTNMMLWSERIVRQIIESEIFKIICQCRSDDLDYNGRLSYLILVNGICNHASQREIEYIAIQTDFIGIIVDSIKDMMHPSIYQQLFLIYLNWPSTV